MQPFVVLAPMDDVTDVVFRSVVESCAAPDLFFTEFVNVDGLCSVGRPKLLHKLMLNKTQKTPVVAQIWGKIPANYEKVANELVEMGFAGIDINMGCPQKNEVKNGCCSALINDRELAHAIIVATQKGAAGRVPVSVKTRLGWDEVDFSWHEFLLGHSLDMLSVHVRTRKEMSDVPAHWELIEPIVALRDKLSPNTKIVLNGDITNYEHGLELAKKHGVDGVMIGRGIFKDLYCLRPGSPWPDMEPQDKIALFLKHIDLFEATYTNRERNFQVLRKFCKTYINGFDSAASLRDEIMQCKSVAEMRRLLLRAKP